MHDRLGVFALSTALAAVVIFAGCSGEESDHSEKPTGDSSARFVTDTSVDPMGESVDVSTIVPVVPCDSQYGPDADLVACPDGFSTSGVETATREIYRQISELDEIRRIKEVLDARLDEVRE